MSLTLTRDGYIQSFEPADEEMAMIQLSDGGRVEWRESKLPWTARDTRMHFEVTVELSETTLPTEVTVDDERATVTTHLTRDVEFEPGSSVYWYWMDSDASGTAVGFASDDLPESFHGEDGEGYARITIEYDHEATLDDPRTDPHSLAVTRGTLDWTTPGVKECWSVSAADRMDATAVDEAAAAAYLAPDAPSGTVRAVDAATGESRWDADLGERVVQLLVGDGTLYVGTAAGIVAVESDSGGRRWEAPATCTTGLERTVVPGGGSQESSRQRSVVAIDGERVTAVDAEAGAVIWERSADQSLSERYCLATVPESGPAGRERAMLYVCGARQNSLYALDIATGELQWKHEADGRIVTTPTVVGDSVYVGTRNDRLLELDGLDGTVSRTFETDGPVETDVVAVDSTLYFACQFDRAYAVDVDRWEADWTHEPERSYPALIVAEDTVYCYDSNETVELDRETGTVEGRHEFGRPAVATAERVYGEASTHAKAFDRSSGSLRWKFGIKGTLTADSERLYVDAEAGIYAEAGFHALTETEAARQHFHGRVDALGDGEPTEATLSLVDPVADRRVESAESLTVRSENLPYYGQFVDAHYEVVVAVDADHEPVTGRRQRKSDQITEFEAEVTDVNGDLVGLSLRELGADGSQRGALRVDSDLLPDAVSNEGTTGYVSIYVEFDAEATPDDAKPDEHF